MSPFLLAFNRKVTLLHTFHSSGSFVVTDPMRAHYQELKIFHPLQNTSFWTWCSIDSQQQHEPWPLPPPSICWVLLAPLKHSRLSPLMRMRVQLHETFLWMLQLLRPTVTLTCHFTTKRLWTRIEGLLRILWSEANLQDDSLFRSLYNPKSYKIYKVSLQGDCRLRLCSLSSP